MKSISKIIVLTIMAAAVVAYAAGKSHKKIFRKPQMPAVDVYRVGNPSDIPVMLKYTARLKSIGDVEVTARIAGTLIKKFYTEGAFVKKGDLLYRIEPDTYKARLEKARADLQNALASLKKAKKDWQRVSILYKHNNASQKTMDSASAAYEIAKANVEGARANLKIATINYNYTYVRAPISGITGMKSVDVGNLVINGTKLLRITKMNPIYAEFSIPDTDVIRYIKDKSLKPSKIAAVLEINGKKYGEQGYVNFIDELIDRRTSSVKARAVFPNPVNYLMPGEFVRIKLEGVYRKNAIVIPQRAVLQNPMGTMVFMVDKGKVQARPIKIGGTSGRYFVVENGLKKGELVIVDNFFRVRPGMPVKIDKIIDAKGR